MTAPTALASRRHQQEQLHQAGTVGPAPRFAISTIVTVNATASVAVTVSASVTVTVNVTVSPVTAAVSVVIADSIATAIAQIGAKRAAPAAAAAFAAAAAAAAQNGQCRAPPPQIAVYPGQSGIHTSTYTGACVCAGASVCSHDRIGIWA
jgi:hypothetical protein